jgi:hypothetical protein
VSALNELSKSRLIIAEGYDDAIFVEQLIGTPARRLPEFDIQANKDLGGVGGNTGFYRAVMAADSKRNFSNVSDVVIIADNDDDATNRRMFVNICNQIQRAKTNGNLQRDWAIPRTPEIREVGDPSVSVWMFPADKKPGCLETLLWEAIKNQRGNARGVACVEAACSCSGADSWPVSKFDKAKVRCFLSLVCRDNPSVSFNDLWRDFPSLIPMNQSAFNPIADFLRQI